MLLDSLGMFVRQRFRTLEIRYNCQRFLFRKEGGNSFVK